ncbi:hypothetical protein TNCV_1564511 [Trichonephila clavipes]|nr:hypothetical protein TNCV_1564511 [Trichonephila clavipes]
MTPFQMEAMLSGYQCHTVHVMRTAIATVLQKRCLVMVRTDIDARIEGTICVWVVDSEDSWLYACVSYDVMVFSTIGLSKAS